MIATDGFDWSQSLIWQPQLCLPSKHRLSLVTLLMCFRRMNFLIKDPAVKLADIDFNKHG
jgi:hypothetical protein